MGFITGPLDIGLSALFESKPDVPSFHWIDLAQQQLDTAAGNLGVLPQAEEMGGQVNQFLRGERAKTLAGIPGLSDLESLQTGNLRSWLRGELPADVAAQVQRRANSQAFAGGYGGSGMAQNLEARDLGLNSLQLMQSAMPLAGAYTSREAAMRQIPEFNPASMFLDPMRAAQFNAQQANQQFQRDWLANRVAAQPDPWQQTLMSDVGSLDALLGTAGGSYLDSYAGAAGKAAGASAAGGGGMSY